MKTRRLVLNVFSLMLVAVGFALASYRFSPQARAALLTAAGRNPVCPLPLAMNSQAMIEEHTQKMAALAQKSKIVQRDGGLELWETPHGRFWIPQGADNHGQDALPSILAEQERSIYGQGETGVQPGDVVLDCGAHVGTFTRDSLNKGAKLVVAIEPSPKNLECLRRNLKDEIAAGRVIVYPKGVYDTEKTLTFHVDAESSSRDTFVDETAKQAGDLSIPVTTIDKLAAELNLPAVNFIKMDIEGAERNALAGGRAVIGKYKPRLAICAYHLPDDPKVLPPLITQLNPAYRFQCGPCGEMDNRIIPHTLLYR